MFGGGVGLDCTLSHELVSPFHIIRVHALSEKRRSHFSIQSLEKWNSASQCLAR